ncbi:MAG: apolipoprotein N-acyltransferase [Thermodesulfobacteriota bacterium]
MAKAGSQKTKALPALRRFRPEYGAVGLAAASGLLLTASFPRLSQSWLAFVALVPLLWVIGAGGPRRAFGYGFLAGLVHFLTLIYWVKEVMSFYGGIPPALAWGLALLLSAFLALYVGAFAALVRTCAAGPAGALGCVPVFWTALEYVRMFLFTGFPWCLLGYSQAENLTLVQAADLFGVFGLSFALALGNAAAFVLLRMLARKDVFGKKPGKKALAATLVLAAALFLCWFVYGKAALSRTEGRLAAAEKIRAAVLQGNIDQAEKWEPALQLSTIRKYLAMAREVSEKGARLVVFPETALPFYFGSEPGLRSLVTDEADRDDALFIVGSPAFGLSGSDYRYYNSAYLVAPGRGEAGRYDKVHLVPWGEYVPLKKYMPWIKKLTQASGDFSTGTPGKLLSFGPLHAGVAVCYEVIFPGLTRRQAQNGANLLVNMTNDAWFGRSSAPYQHFSMAVLRAVEFRRSLLRAANTGISALVLPTGRVPERTEIFTDAEIVFDVPLIQGTTLYQSLGDVLPLACCVLGLLFILAAIRRRLEGKEQA